MQRETRPRQGEGDRYDDNRLIRLYLEEIGQHPILPSEEVKDLSSRYQSARKAIGFLGYMSVIGMPVEPQDVEPEMQDAIEVGFEAKDRLVQCNLKLVVSWAKRYKEFKKAPLDLIQEGNLGLMKAVDGFNPELGFEFSTYATYWIKQSIRRGIRKNRTIRTPEPDEEKLADYRSQIEAELTREEIKKKLSIDEEYLQKLELLASVHNLLSLSQPVGEEIETPLSDIVPDASTQNFDQSLIDSEEVGALMRMAGLTDREITMLTMKYAGNHKLTVIGKRFGLSRERIRQLLNVAENKMKIAAGTLDPHTRGHNLRSRYMVNRESA